MDEVDYNLYPQREHQLKWIAVYLDEAAKLRGNACEHHVQMQSSDSKKGECLGNTCFSLVLYLFFF